MGLQGDTPWTLEQLVALLKQILITFTPPFTIVIYSQYGVGEVQRALAAQGLTGKQERLQLTNFLMVKVRNTFLNLNAAWLLHSTAWCCLLQDSMQEGRVRPGSSTVTHVYQEVVVVHHTTTKLRLQHAGPQPLRYFQPVGPGPLDDTSTDGG